ncbi:hypothetical protein THRCLA_08628 [Thraustotheca clavata]|uniref:Uncharacterized protein n=1 Tax=Thraustotheca clavata TaxID=74557 RepID=A0A1V9Z3V6_9STRA|nr:hypothetical protein THRCLA_08628 [Thraustotheca clavata]
MVAPLTSGFSAVHNTSAQSDFLALPLNCFILPFGSNTSATGFTNGGNLLCGNDVPMVETLPHAHFSDYIRPTVQIILLAFCALSRNNVSFNKNVICSMDSMASTSCASDYEFYQQFHSDYLSSHPIHVNDVLQAVRALNIELIQFIRDDEKSQVYIARQPYYKVTPTGLFTLGFICSNGLMDYGKPCHFKEMLGRQIQYQRH